MPNNLKIRIQKPIHTIRRTALLPLIQLPTLNRRRDAFAPADIREVVYGYTKNKNISIVLFSAYFLYVYRYVLLDLRVWTGQWSCALVARMLGEKRMTYTVVS
jgi:hypothetical protein